MTMLLELPHIELRYETLRVVDAARESSLAASLLAEGQRHPVLTFAQGERFVLVDGYRRVRALRGLARDEVLAMDLGCEEAEALLYGWRAGVSRRLEAVEEGWMLRELVSTQGLSHRELGARMGRTASWICRRLALVQVLPEVVQRHLQRGQVCAYVAQKVLVPLARANAEDCVIFVERIAGERLSSRQIGQWWRAWRSADAETRARLVREPLLYLRAAEASKGRGPLAKETPEGNTVATMAQVATACWRARDRLHRLLHEHPELTAHASVGSGAAAARRAFHALDKVLEGFDVGSGHAHVDSAAAH